MLFTMIGIVTEVSQMTSAVYALRYRSNMRMVTSCRTRDISQTVQGGALPSTSALSWRSLKPATGGGTTKPATGGSTGGSSSGF